MTDLAVILVTWNTCALVLNALRSLFADLNEHGPSAAVYVVDNASTDGTVEAIRAEFAQVNLIASRENLGFAGGNNQVLRQIGFGGPDKAELPKAVYLLNSDTVTTPGATRKLYDGLFSDDGVGLVGARLTYGDGRFQHSAFAFPDLRQLWVEFFPVPGRWTEGRFNGRYPASLYDGERPFPVDCVLGATMMLRREVIQQTGLFDEQFFMYCEEIDWAWRIHKAGWLIRCVPTAEVVHLAGQSTSQIRAQSIINLWTSRLRLFDKHYPSWKNQIARWMIAIGMRRKMRQAEHSGLSGDEQMAAYETVYRMALNS